VIYVTFDHRGVTHRIIKRKTFVKRIKPKTRNKSPLVSIHDIISKKRIGNDKQGEKVVTKDLNANKAARPSKLEEK
jgi:hypothetical protein